MGNKNGAPDAILDETKQLLMQRTGKKKKEISSSFFIRSMQ